MISLPRDSPGSLIMRGEDGRPVDIPISSIPEDIKPDNFYQNSYWMHRPDGEELKELVMGYLNKRDLTHAEVQALAQYIYDYNGNIAVASYLLSGRDKGILEFQVEVMGKLREVLKMASERKHINEMINIGRDYGNDPL